MPDGRKMLPDNSPEDSITRGRRSDRFLLLRRDPDGGVGTVGGEGRPVFKHFWKALAHLFSGFAGGPAENEITANMH